MWKIEVTGTPAEVQNAIANMIDESDHQRTAKTIHDCMLEAFDEICNQQTENSQITLSAECKPTRNNLGLMEYNVTSTICVANPEVVNEALATVTETLTDYKKALASQIGKKPKSRK